MLFLSYYIGVVVRYYVRIYHNMLSSLLSISLYTSHPDLISPSFKRLTLPPPSQDSSFAINIALIGLPDTPTHILFGTTVRVILPVLLLREILFL